MNGGDLTDLVDIEQFTTTSTGDRGEPVGTWTVLYQGVPAGVKVLSGRKLVLAKELFPTALYHVQIHWLAGVSVKQRIRVTYISHLPEPAVNMLMYIGHCDFTDGLLLTCSSSEL